MLNLGMEPLEIGDTLLLLVTLIIMIYLIGKFAYGPVNKMLEDRRNKINDDLDHAQSEREKASELAAQRQKEVDSSRDEASSIIAKAEKDGQKQKAGIIEQAHEEAANIQKRAKDDLASQKDQMLDQVKNNLVEVSTKMAANILKDQIDEDKQKQSIDDFLQKIEASK
ncbi:F0F1 ATP synthase subunit B [Xylocopilactobacillus apicola]|uniref:ATP synthase subunit b n=1 Tax=Xylocopilactobacillus apicola TaxID=2932184 RepID=A0AAU9D7A8_9LACO|nr:F0F1 ATP synthase subunit B [Xylocopilactobacillus apicola]BDR58271.1 ATP synthase subunit b [Xylocopilactobacillus apicola]